MARRPKTNKEKVYVIIKKSPEPMSTYMIAIKLKVAKLHRTNALHTGSCNKWLYRSTFIRIR